MAPEVVNRKGHTTADWWSFGVLLVRGRQGCTDGRRVCGGNRMRCVLVFATVIVMDWELVVLF